MTTSFCIFKMQIPWENLPVYAHESAFWRLLFCILQLVSQVLTDECLKRAVCYWCQNKCNSFSTQAKAYKLSSVHVGDRGGAWPLCSVALAWILKVNYANDLRCQVKNVPWLQLLSVLRCLHLYYDGSHTPYLGPLFDNYFVKVCD